MSEDKPTKPVRHLLGLSGGKDSSVLAIYFSDIRSYPPGQYPGLVVLRLNDQSRPAVLRVLTRILPLFETETLPGRLWIVDENQVRIRGGDINPMSVDPR